MHVQKGKGWGTIFLSLNVSLQRPVPLGRLFPGLCPALGALKRTRQLRHHLHSDARVHTRGATMPILRQLIGAGCKAIGRDLAPAPE